MQKDEITILYEDKDILVAIKPVGVLSENAQNGEMGIIGLLSKRAGKDLYLLHRLDRTVGGVMVFANNKKSASKLSRDIAEGKFYKEYLLVTDNVPAEKNGVYKDLLFKDSSKNRSYVVKRTRKGVKEASLEYEVLNSLNNKAFCRALLHTGRTHQIRVQFASRKTPLSGDRKYGSKDNQSKNIALFSYRISFNHPTDNKKMVFMAEPNFNEYPWCLFGGINNEGFDS